MKFLAASVPRSVRTARLGHLRSGAILGTWHIQNPDGSFQLFDVVMQPEAEFLRIRNHLAAPPAVTGAPHQGPGNAPYVLKDIRQLDVPDSAPNPAETAGAHFRKEFKLS